MIKSVAQALPTYTMSTFEIPKKVCDNLDSQMRTFWRNPKAKGGRYLAWKAWDHLCQPKELGGLGFRHSHDFNRALIAKLAWMVATKNDNLCYQVLRSKYKVRHNWLRGENNKEGSSVWKAIEKAKPLIAKGTCFLIGDGNSIDVCMDPWIPWVESFKPKPNDDSTILNPLAVSSLIDLVTKAWKVDLLRRLFEEELVAAIQKIRIPIIPS
jgi:hypothetical protein